METEVIKIDPQGKFSKFPGVTVVAAIQNGDVEKWRQVYSELETCTLLRQYYSLLPFESYHMTTSDLYTQKRLGLADFQSTIHKELTRFKELYQMLNDKPFSPEIILDSVYINNVVMFLEVKLKDEHQLIVKSVAEQFGITANIPKIFHVSLAYSYKEPDDKTIEAIKKEVENNLTCLGKTFTLDSPKLCYFNDMTAFIPWNAEKYPFI